MCRMRYHFREIEACPMCGSPTATHRILGKRLNKPQGRKPASKTGITTTVAKCTDCGLVYANPQPIPFDLQDHYGVPPESYWKDDYFHINDDYFQGEIARLKELIDVQPGMKSLDIGAGVGKQMTVLERIGFDTYGLEPSEPFYERALQQMKIAPEKLTLGKLEDLDYPENTFDFISFGVVLEHLYDPGAAIEKALKWLKNDGIIHIEVPSADWLTNRLINQFYRLKGSDYVSNLSPMHEPYHLYEFSLQSFERNAQRTGYSIAFHEYYVCPTFLPKVFDPILRPYMKRTNTGMQLCVWLRKHDEVK